ncbi:hypothetical protein ABZ917_32365 [Nonomuraea wenchangensis]
MNVAMAAWNSGISAAVSAQSSRIPVTQGSSLWRTRLMRSSS